MDGMSVHPASGAVPLSSVARRAAGLLPTGVSIIESADAFLTISSLQWVSCDPPWVSVAIDRASQRGQVLLAGRVVTIRVLTEAQAGMARAAAPPAPDVAGVMTLGGEIDHIVPVGTHDLALIRLARIDLHEGRPLVYWRGGLVGLALVYPWLASAATLAAFVAAWEAGTLPKREWSHAAHVTIGACYVVRHGASAFDYTRAGIRRYNAAVGTANTDTSGYHETLTRFWADVLALLVAGETDEWQAARRAVARYGEDRDLHVLHYGFDVVRSVEARRRWIAPDLVPLPARA
jgi:flavin reductase (DIM6/NTAB) family NADH-FMN oxidoreductase RutF